MFAMKYRIKNTDNVSGITVKSYRIVYDLRTQNTNSVFVFKELNKREKLMANGRAVQV